MILDDGTIYNNDIYRVIEKVLSTEFNFKNMKWESLVVYIYNNEMYQMILKNDYLYQTFKYKNGYRFKVPDMIAIGLEKFE